MSDLGFSRAEIERLRKLVRVGYGKQTEVLPCGHVLGMLGKSGVTTDECRSCVTCQTYYRACWDDRGNAR